jgi:hypothetical protein
MVPLGSQMFSVRRVHLQVLRAIVRGVVVAMVNPLAWQKLTPQHLLCDQNVLQHIAVRSRPRMAWIPKKDVSLPRLDVAATLPIWVLRPPLAILRER